MIHEYKCTKCKNTFDVRKPVDTPIMPVTPCECGGKAKRIFGNFHWKRGETWPKYNPQLGKMVRSRYEEDREFAKLGAVEV